MHCSLSQMFSKSPYLFELLISIEPLDTLYQNQRKWADTGRLGFAVSSGLGLGGLPHGCLRRYFNISIPRT